MIEKLRRPLKKHPPTEENDDDNISSAYGSDGLRLLKKAEKMYHTFIGTARMRLFDYMSRCTDVHVAISDDTSGRHPYKRPLVCLPIMAGRVDLGTARRFTNPIKSAVADALKKNKHTVWIPIRITCPERNNDHSNAITIDLKQKTITLFEPHGSDPRDPGHGSWQYYYDAPSYYNQAKTKLQEALPGFTVRLPTDYQPAVFGQSRTLVKRLLTGHDDNGDDWCALWTTLFLRYTQRLSPLQFIRNVNLMKDNVLTTFIAKELLIYTQWTAAENIKQNDTHMK